ncbi:hypothetical protein FO440_15105 [Mucilaginibacter corticis]|uniref:Uncharacterized protein n=1 Tax=Mucilaginibacter corticis TaxID=2597670 RepID=A0A556MMA1_9SPHI|nr:hypothetical protein [Mucilaginibacter corticis]TSJ41056.1 hypothetical protein FO440_15105 [Mucilaginibacter corticis]
MKTSNLLTLLTLAVCLSACKPKPGQVVSTTELIKPGKSIGQVTINETDQNLLKVMGKPDSGDSAMGKSAFTWYAGHSPKGAVTQIFLSRGQGDDAVKRVKQIRITDTRFLLMDSIHVGKPLAALEKSSNLKEIARFTDKGAGRVLYDDTLKGIAFDTDDKAIITGITVHETGKNARETYMPFFPDLK